MQPHDGPTGGGVPTSSRPHTVSIDPSLLSRQSSALLWATRRLLISAFLLAVGSATWWLWIVSRGKWGYAIVDSGREWIVPDCLARGELLYRDVVYWFGPLTPYLHALLFRLFGSSFPTLVLAGVLTSIAVLAALHTALRQVTGRMEAALGTALAVPALLFMPSAGGTILGMGYRIWHAAVFTLFAVSIAIRPFRFRRAIGAGVLCALALLCRTEWGLAAMGGVTVAAATRDRFRLTFLRDVSSAALPFLALGGGVLAIFIRLAGADAVLRDGHLLLTGLTWETSQFLLNLSGLHDPLGGFIRLLFSAAAWAGVFLVVDLAATGKEDRARTRRRLPWLGGIAVILIAYRDYSGTTRMVFMSGSPLIGVAALGFGLRRLGGPRSAALSAFGALAVILSYRKLFSIADSAYVAPPLLFVIVSGFAILRQLVVSERVPAARQRLRRSFETVLAALVLFVFADRIIVYTSDPRVPLPGTGRMLTADPEAVRTLTDLSESIRRRLGENESLVVFPEGEILNAMTGRRNPIRHKLYIPGYLESGNELGILSELRAARPAAIVIINRDTAEYGRRLFGVNYAQKVRSWIEDEYALTPFHGDYLTLPFDPKRRGARMDTGVIAWLYLPREGRFSVASRGHAR